MRPDTRTGTPTYGDRDPITGFDVFPEFAQFAADSKFTVPIAATFPLQDWRTALEISLSGQAHGKLLLLP